MSDVIDISMDLDEKIEKLTQAEFDRAVEVFKEKVTAHMAHDMNACVHCGLCSDSCHYYLADGRTESIPAYKIELIISVFKKYCTFTGKHFGFLNGARRLNKEMVREWADVLFGRCTMCGRCSLNCSVGLNISGLIRAARSALESIGIVPSGLQSTVNTAVEKGNNMGIAKEDWLETVEWIEEEFQDEVGDPNARFPLDKKGANLFYTVNPREPMFFPLSISAVGKIFYAAGEDWTFSSDDYDVTNYGFFNGSDNVGRTLSKRLIDTIEALQCRTMVLAECGHGFNAHRWEAPEWLEKSFDFEIKSILDVVADYIREGRIKLDPSKNPDPVTIHDPCNLVRMGGVIETQRFILAHAVENIIEMTPNREKNFCCGGGGGQLAMTRFADRRLKSGSIKAEQIRKTGASIVATPCHNCIDQLSELNKEYKLGVQIKTVCELVAKALVL